MSQPNYSGKKGGGGDRTESKMEKMDKLSKGNRAAVISALRRPAPTQAPAAGAAMEQVEQPATGAAMEQVEQQATGAAMEEDYDSDVSDLGFGSQPFELDDKDHRDLVAPPTHVSQVQTRGPKPAAGAGGPGDNDGYDAGDDDSMNGASTATNLSAKSQASIQTIAESVAESVDGLPLPDGGLMLIELVEGVYRLTVAGMNYFNTVAEIAGGYGPIASIAFISLLSANPKLLPTLSLPTMDLTGIASQIGLTANAAAVAANAAAPTGIFSSLTSAATLIGNGITAGVTAIVAAIGTNSIVANPLTIDNIAGMVESAGHNAIGAVITVAEFQRRMMVVLKKLKANWTVKNLQVEGISTLQKDNINNLVNRALTTHAGVLVPNDNGEQPLTEEQLRNTYNGIVNDINNVASTEPVHAIEEGEDVEAIQNAAADQLIENADPPAAGGGGGTAIGGKKNRKSQKKPRKKVTRSKRGKKAARKTKKQSRRKSRGKKHGKKH